MKNLLLTLVFPFVSNGYVYTGIVSPKLEPALKLTATNTPPDSPYSLNEWACNKVYELNEHKSLGCYDICLSIGSDKTLWMQLSKNQIATLENACAIVVHGAEW